MEIVTSEDLQHIFYSGYSAATSWDVLDDLYIAIHSQALEYERCKVCSIESYHAMISTAEPAFGPGPQGAGHMTLKAIGKQWMRSQYHLEASYEVYFSGLHPDVLSENCQYVIECGTTDPGCVRIYLSQPIVSWVGNIAYPFDEDTGIFLHMFRRGPKFASWQDDQVARLRKVFRKYK